MARASSSRCQLPHGSNSHTSASSSKSLLVQCIQPEPSVIRPLPTPVLRAQPPVQLTRPHSTPCSPTPRPLPTPPPLSRPLSEPCLERTSSPAKRPVRPLPRPLSVRSYSNRPLPTPGCTSASTSTTPCSSRPASPPETPAKDPDPGPSTQTHDSPLARPLLTLRISPPFESLLGPLEELTPADMEMSPMVFAPIEGEEDDEADLDPELEGTESVSSHESDLGSDWDECATVGHPSSGGVHTLSALADGSDADAQGQEHQQQHVRTRRQRSTRGSMHPDWVLEKKGKIVTSKSARFSTVLRELRKLR